MSLGRCALSFTVQIRSLRGNLHATHLQSSTYLAAPISSHRCQPVSDEAADESAERGSSEAGPERQRSQPSASPFLESHDRFPISLRSTPRLAKLTHDDMHVPKLTRIPCYAGVCCGTRRENSREIRHEPEILVERANSIGFFVHIT